MIQRIQTVFLAGVAVICLVLFYLPLYSSGPSANAIPQPFLIGGNALLTALNCMVLLLALIAVFLYKNRNNQVKLCLLNMLLSTFLVLANFYVADQSVQPGAIIHFEAGSYLLLGDLIFLGLAIRFIKKDERLVRAADRLR